MSLGALLGAALGSSLAVATVMLLAAGEASAVVIGIAALVALAVGDIGEPKT